MPCKQELQYYISQLKQIWVRANSNTNKFVWLQTQEQAGDSSTYWGQTIRMMPLASIDPSLAIGFYCRSLGTAILVTAVSLHMYSIKQVTPFHSRLSGRCDFAFGVDGKLYRKYV